MKKLYSFLIPALVLTFIFSTGLTAQETTVSVKVKKDGKVVKDTTYSFEDAAQAEHALMMMDMMGGDDEHMMKVHNSMSESHGGHSKTMVFVSEDGKTTEISEGDHHGEHDGENVKVIKYKIESDGDHDHGQRVMIVKTGDGETFDILIDEDGEAKDEDGNVVKTKEVKVIVTSDDDGEWTVTETEMDEEKNVEVIVIEEKVVKKKSKKQ
jgi:hypothetical protein